MNKKTTAAPNVLSAVTSYLAAIGRKGGASGKGKSKSRSKSQARKAALARWEKVRESRKNTESDIREIRRYQKMLDDV